MNEETARGQLTTRSANDAFYRVPRGSGIGAMRIIASVEENIVRGHATDKKGPTRKAERIPNARESASTRILPGFLLLINNRVRFVGNFIAFLTTVSAMFRISSKRKRIISIDVDDRKIVFSRLC